MSFFQRHFSLIFQCNKKDPQLVPCLFSVWLAINDDSDKKSFSDLSDSDMLLDVTSANTK